MTNTAPRKFNIKPARDICETVTHPLPKTIAFGGVATGNMKANEAERVAGIIRYKGCVSPVDAMPANIGKIIVAVAVLEVNSVRKVIPRQIVMRTNQSGR